MAWFFMAFMCSPVITSAQPVAVMKMSAIGRRLLHRHDLVALHRGLERADGIDLGDQHASALRRSDCAEPLPTSP
jgi:hypothetical protein